MRVVNCRAAERERRKLVSFRSRATKERVSELTVAQVEAQFPFPTIATLVRS